MNANQVELARHALGLPNGRGVSYRNRFVTGPGSPDYSAWMEMVEFGAATRRAAHTVPFGGSDIFYLTTPGALYALKPHEMLDIEDFPDTHRHRRSA